MSVSVKDFQFPRGLTGDIGYAAGRLYSTTPFQFPRGLTQYDIGEEQQIPPQTFNSLED